MFVCFVSSSFFCDNGYKWEFVWMVVFVFTAIRSLLLRYDGNDGNEFTFGSLCVVIRNVVW